jgi:hypothetical protein
MRPVSGCHKARDPYYPRGRGLAKCSFWREISHRGWRKMAFVCALSNSIRVRTWRALKNFDCSSSMMLRFAVGHRFRLRRNSSANQRT